MYQKKIKGYPVVNLADGTLLGRVQDLIINPLEKKVKGLIVGEKGFLKGKTRQIPFMQIYNIGKDVLLIRDEEQTQIPAAETYVPLEEFKDYSFLGSSVVSSQGDYIAKVQDFTFSVQTGDIKDLLLYDFPARNKKDKNIFLSIDGVLNLGKDYVIASPDYISYIREEEKASQTEQTGQKEQIKQLEQPEKIFQDDSPAAEYKISSEDQLQEKSLSLHNIFHNIKEIWDHLEKEIAGEGRELAKESKEKIKRYLLHKKTNYTIKSNEGQPLVKPGMEITEEILQQAEAQNKIFNLFLAVISQELEDNLTVFREKIRTTFR